MKRCPECRRDYYDDSLLYCLDDGAALLEGPSSADQETAILSESTTLADRLSPPIAGIAQSGRLQPAASTQGSHAIASQKWVAAGAGLLLVVVGIGLVSYKLSSSSDKAPSPTQVERLTTNGKTSDVAISPDGKFVVYVVDEEGQQSIWTRPVATNSNVQIIPPAHVNYRGLMFSPDGNYINFVRQEKRDVPPVLYQMPALGGVQKTLISNISGAAGYSPDGNQIAFIRSRFPTANESSLLVANSDGSAERILISIKRPDFFPTSTNQSPAWSPDGKSIAAIVGNISSNDPSVVEVQVADGSLKTIPGQNLEFIARLAWLPDKSGLLLLGADRAMTQPVWLLPYPGGEVRKITSDLNMYFGMSLTADAHTFATVQQNVISSIWVAPPGDPGRAVQIKSGGSNYDGMGGLAWTADGRIVYHSMAGGALDVWIMNGNGSGQKQLTSEGVTVRAKVTPDGRYIVFESISKGEHNIWRMDLDGGNPIQLTNGNSDNFPSVTPDSRWVVYTSRRTQDWRLWKVPVDGGQPEQLTDQRSRNALVSPDGKFIFCEYDSGENSRWKKAVIAFEGGALVKFLDIPGFANVYRWSKDSRSITYLESQGGVVNLWSFPLDGTPSKQLTNFKTEETFDFDWSPDGSLVLARGPVTSDVVLISNFR